MRQRLGIPLLLAASFVAGTWYSQRRAAGKDPAGGRKALYYVDPMHPAYKSDKPGIAPDCGMQLEPVYEEGAPVEERRAPAPAPGAVRIGAAQQQLIGLRESPVEKMSTSHTLRLLGRAVPDETRVYKLIADADGFIREVSTVTTGSQVRKDQWLATFSAPEARAPIQGFLVAVDVVERQSAGGARDLAQVRAASESTQLAVDRLLNLGLSQLQVDEIRQTRQVPTELRIAAPEAGFVIARNVAAGQRFEKGAEWFRIADLNRIWILADAFPADSKFIRPGQTARVTIPGRSEVFTAKVSEILPQFDPGSRTMKVRLEMANPGFLLRPDMFVDAEVPVSSPPAIAVSADAVLDTGLSKRVFVSRGDGFFEPREVETGQRFGDRVQIVKGLEPGERIVVSGNFLIDSESRMRLAAENAATVPMKMAAANDPVCGMEVDPRSPRALKAEHGGKTYHFCSEQCRRSFLAKPAGHLPGKQSARQTHGPRGPA